MREYTTIQHRRGTEAQWSAANPVLALGEIGVEVSATGVRFKVGDGASRWSEILYDDTSALRAEVTSLGSNVDLALTGEVSPSRVPGIVLEASPLVPVTYDGSDLTHAWTDRDGHVAMGIKDDATVAFSRGVELPDGSLPVEYLDSASVLTTSAGDDWAYAFTDTQGRISAAVDRRGVFRVFRGAGAAEPMRNRIACMGDSLTRGYDTGSTWPIEDSWPYKLDEDYSNKSVFNLGYPGRTVDEIRVLTGSLPLVVRPVEGAIPSSGTVNLLSSQVVGWGSTTSISLAGTLAGVPGILQYTPTAYTFTRSVPGDQVTVTGSVPFMANLPDYSADVVVFWAGRNDVNQDIYGQNPTVAEHVVSSVLELVEWMATRTKSVIVIGTTNNVAETRGTPRYETITEINRRLGELLPHKYLNIRQYLVNQAIYDAGVTPTEADLANMGNDAPPQSIWDNGSHFIKPIAPHVAAFIGEHLASKGFL